MAPHPASFESAGPMTASPKPAPLDGKQRKPLAARAQRSSLPSPLKSAAVSVEKYIGSSQELSSDSSGPSIAAEKPSPMDRQQRMPALARAQRSARPSPSISNRRNVLALVLSPQPESSESAGPSKCWEKSVA